MRNRIYKISEMELIRMLAAASHAAVITGMVPEESDTEWSNTLEELVLLGTLDVLEDSTSSLQ